MRGPSARLGARVWKNELVGVDEAEPAHGSRTVTHDPGVVAAATKALAQLGQLR